MKTKNNFTIWLFVAGISIATCTCVSAGTVRRAGSYQTGTGCIGSFTQNIHRQSGSSERNTTVQSGNRVWTRQSDANWNRATGTASRTTVTTAPSGKTASIDRNVTRNGNTVAVNTSRTGYNGKTSNWTKTVTADGNGTASINGQHVRQYGNVASTSSTVQRTSSGHITTGSYTTSAGKSGTYQKQVINGYEAQTKIATVTGSNGHSVKRIVRTTPDGATVVRIVKPTQ